MDGDGDTGAEDREASESPATKDKLTTPPELSAQLWGKEARQSRSEPLLLAQAGEESDRFKPVQKPQEFARQPVLLTATYDAASQKFDKKLTTEDYDVLRIKGLPADKVIRPGVDEKGYYIQIDDKKPNGKYTGQPSGSKHYIPDTLKRIEIPDVLDKSGKQVRYYQLDGTKLRMSANEGFFEQKRREEIENKMIPKGMSREDAAKDKALQEAIDRAVKQSQEDNPSGFRSLTGKPSSRQDEVSQLVSRARSLTSVPSALDPLENALVNLITKDPDNPYSRLALADVYLAQAMRPIFEELKSFRSLSAKEIFNPVQNGGFGKLSGLGDQIEKAFKKLDNKETQEYLNAAIEQAKHAITCTRSQSGNVREPSGLLTNRYAPLAYDCYLDPSRRGDYWLGAMDQAYLRKFQLEAIKEFIKLGAGKFVKLPPDNTR